jgi:hypothetical protein
VQVLEAPPQGAVRPGLAYGGALTFRPAQREVKGGGAYGAQRIVAGVTVLTIEGYTTEVTVHQHHHHHHHHHHPHRRRRR